MNASNERKYLEEFINEFNNVKLPSKKYYDIYKWQYKEMEQLLKKRKREKDKLTVGNSENINYEDEEFVFDDEGKKEKEKKIMKELEQKRRLEEAIYTMNKEKVKIAC